MSTHGGPFYDYTGLDDAATMLGRTVARIYFVTPGDYTISATGIEHDTLLGALREAAARKREQHATHGRSMNASVPLPPKVSVDVRWVLDNGTDLVAKRHTYHSVLHVEQHIDNIVRYAHVGV